MNSNNSYSVNSSNSEEVPGSAATGGAAPPHSPRSPRRVERGPSARSGIAFPQIGCKYSSNDNDTNNNNNNASNN